jgi:sulfur-carrier protein adenylyltransferase/sulfurtransferase
MTQKTENHLTHARYLKQILLEGFGVEAQEKLLNARVLVIGAGGLGCPVITYLSAAGVGCLGIMDHDLIEESNLHRQPLYSIDDIGRTKVQVAAHCAGKLNPGIKIIPFYEKITPANAGTIIRDFDLILDCTDNYEARYLINDACILAGKAWIYGAVEAWEGQMSVFNYTFADGSKTATYRCIFPEAPETSLSCNDAGIIGTMPGFIGMMQANEAIKVITGTGAVQNGLLLADMLHNRFQTIRVARNDEEIGKINAIKEDYSPVCETTAAEEISLETLLSKKEQYFVIDIREKYEIDEEAFFLTDLQIPVQDLLSNGYDFKNSHTYVLACASGKRSMAALRKIKNQYPHIEFFSLRGGVGSATTR